MDILVGNKPVKSYLVYAIVSIAKDSLTVKARGRAITKAVDLVEILKRRMKCISVSGITIGTDTVIDKETKRAMRVSSIAIVVNSLKDKGGK